MQRRTFLAASASAFAAPAAPAAPVRFGVDLFSLRSQNWDAFQHLDYCAKFGAKVVHFSEIRFLGPIEKPHLEKVRAHAERLGIQVEVGMRSICPTAKSFDPKQGSAEQQLSRMIDAAVWAGSPIVRCFLGFAEDRAGPVPMEQHIENVVRVLRSARSKALDAGKKIAIENHGGDMQAREVKMLIEEAGKDFVGACLDSGNPLWAIEDPLLTLETLAPYVLTSHIRDTAVWREPEGIAVQWVRLGEGNVGMDEFARRFQQLCPGRAFSMEVIAVPKPRIYPYQDPKFWEAYRKTPAWEFSRFLALADRGKPYQGLPAVSSKEEGVVREREDLEASIAYCHGKLHI